MICGYQLRDCQQHATRVFIRREGQPLALCDRHALLADSAIQGGAPGELVTLAEWERRQRESERRVRA